MATKDNTTPELKDCPFCGSSDIECGPSRYNEDKDKTWCFECGASGPDPLGERDWNTRA